jgi:hypothetical protein
MDVQLDLGKALDQALDVEIELAAGVRMHAAFNLRRWQADWPTGVAARCARRDAGLRTFGSVYPVGPKPQSGLLAGMSRTFVRQAQPVWYSFFYGTRYGVETSGNTTLPLIGYGEKVR